jgi:hypothetical protein
MSESPEAPTTFERRELIRKGALAGGGLVWGLPLIRSIHVVAAVGSQPPGDSTCCTCNCSGPEGRVVLQSCNPGLTLGECESVCRAFCTEQQLFPETVDWSDCGATGNPSCGGPTAQGAQGSACSCCGVSGQSCTTNAQCCSGICNAGVCA